MLYASLAPNVAGEIEALPSVLKGNVLTYHVVSCFFGIAAFGISCLVSSLVLIIGNPNRSMPFLKRLEERLPSSPILEDLSYKTLAIGFILFSIGMATGIYQTKVVWHIYWNWDPVQTCTLITWLLYALILHGRYQRWWGIKASSLLSLVAFITLIFSALIAANYIMSSGHYPIV
jgi:ABC-type transport system involved in cytochrome c biogenesis permease subunit